jgi:hypothetical protein
MSESTHVVGFRPADEKWNKMKAVWNACESAGVEIPKEAMDFFDSVAPGDRPGAEVELGEALQEWEDDSRQGYELDVTKLPPDVKVIRFYNSW